MKSSAQNPIMRQLKLMEAQLNEIQCHMIKDTVLNWWQIVLPDGQKIAIEHAGGGHWIFRANGLEKSHPVVRLAVLRAIAEGCRL